MHKRLKGVGRCGLPLCFLCLFVASYYECSDATIDEESHQAGICNESRFASPND